MNTPAAQTEPTHHQQSRDAPDAPAHIWIIGDLQGCCAPLCQLLAHPDIAADPGARFWFAGDLVNRGPDSLGALRAVIALGDRATVVLGNHDLHLLATAAGIRQPSRADTLDDILNAPDADALVDWLRQRPLAYYAHDHLLVHAGVLASWSVAKTLDLAHEVETALRDDDWRSHLAHLYGNKPVRWKDSFHGNKRLRAIVNALTRMRMCSSNGDMEFKYKREPEPGQELIPWFDVPERAARDTTVVFGHWSALGLLMRPDVVCLDTGCVWGGKLTAMRMSDRHLVQVACAQYRKPG
ncbi:MAG: symmetrical bis(5'-nucleosyl)-tetraphosphatase [Candidimonas sp.]|nr:MAG: symmetrical bis(5'-nucleosyl)-tetraphosphatase [Candidimonas sp.]